MPFAKQVLSYLNVCDVTLILTRMIPSGACYDFGISLFFGTLNDLGHTASVQKKRRVLR